MEYLQMKYYPKEVYYENRNSVNYIILDYGDSKVEHRIAAEHSVQADGVYCECNMDYYTEYFGKCVVCKKPRRR